MEFFFGTLFGIAATFITGIAMLLRDKQLHINQPQAPALIPLKLGETFRLLHTSCPSCGQDLCKEPVQAVSQQGKPDNIKNQPNGADASWMASDHPSRAINSGSENPSLQRVIDPLSQPPKENPH